MNNSRLCMVCNSVDTSYFDHLYVIKKWFNDNGIKTINKNINKIINELNIKGAFRHNTFCKYKISGCSKIETLNNKQNNLANEVEQLFATYIYNKDFDRVHSLLILLRGFYPREYKILEIQYRKYK